MTIPQKLSSAFHWLPMADQFHTSFVHISAEETTLLRMRTHALRTDSHMMLEYSLIHMDASKSLQDNCPTQSCLQGSTDINPGTLHSFQRCCGKLSQTACRLLLQSPAWCLVWRYLQLQAVPEKYAMLQSRYAVKVPFSLTTQLDRWMTLLRLHILCPTA